MTEPDPGTPVDPARHLLAERWNTQLWFSPEPAVPGSDPPVPLDAHVAQWRARIDAERLLEPATGRLDATVISAERARVIAALLREFASRLRPGRTAGPIVSDGSLADLATELHKDLFLRIPM